MVQQRQDPDIVWNNTRYGSRTETLHLVAMAVFAAALCLVPDGHVHPGNSVALLGVLAMSGWQVLRPARTRLHGDLLIVREPTRSRTVRAADIQGMAVHPEFRGVALVWGPTGRPLRIGFGGRRHDSPEFQAGLADLEAWWVAHRGADWNRIRLAGT